MATPPAPATALLPHVDELVLEYLLFRGFTRSFQALAAERKRDRAKGFDVEQITSQLLAFVQNFQLEPMLDTWKFLDARFFSRLDASYTSTIRQLEDAWLRLYVVHAIKSGHRDKAVEFFRLLADKLNAKSSASGGESWHRWFILPYVQHPESDPFFRSFFEKQWLDSFVTSFRNFLSLIFRNMALPKLLALQVGRLEEPALKLRLKTSQSECSRLRFQNAKSAERIHRLEDAGLKMLHMVETLVQHTFAEHFADVDSGFSWSDKIPEDGTAAPEVVKALSTLSSQLVELREALGPASRNDATRTDQEVLAVLDDPLAIKLSAVSSPAKGTSSDQDAAITIVGMSSSPSSSSLQSADSVPSPAHANSVILQPALVEEVSLAFDSSDAKEGICKYAHDGRRLVTSRVGEHIIKVLDINVNGHTVERENIQTEAAVVGVDWVAHSECLVYALEDGTINVWDTDAKARTFIISYNADERRPSRLACAPSKAVGAVALVAAAGDFTEASNVTRVQFFAFEDQAIRVLSSVELEGRADVSSLRWASGGSTLAVVDNIGNVSFVSPSEASILGSWRLGTAEFPISGVCFGPGGESLLVVGASARLVMEWSVSDLIAARSSDPPPYRAVYQLPPEMTDTDGITTRMIEIQGARSVFAVSSNTKSLRDIWTVYTRDRPDPVMTVPTEVTGHIEALAWHPLDNALAVTTAAGKLYVWKLSEQSGGM